MRKPLTGAILGVLIGLALAVILARQGFWPADQITVFLLPALVGFIGLLLLSVGRPSSGPFTLVVALLILVPMLIWGALGLGTINQHGELNGGCRVFAASDVDQTDVIDTTKSDPFVIDPDGGLAWEAESPEVFEDYDWNIDVVVGGIPITVDSGTEANDLGDQDNDGDIPDIRAYGDERGFDIDTFVGVYQVGGEAATCDGFGFVEILGGEGLDTISLVSIILLVTFMIILIVLMFVGRGGTTTVAGGSASGSAGRHEAPNPAPDTDDGLDAGSDEPTT